METLELGTRGHGKLRHERVRLGPNTTSPLSSPLHVTDFFNQTRRCENDAQPKLQPRSARKSVTFLAKFHEVRVSNTGQDVSFPEF